MQYVGNLLNSVTTFYQELNPATLSGAIDVIVIKHEDGSLHCSPFHVRFGKLQLLRPQDKIVNVKVNGETIPYKMKLGDSGEAFFVFHTDNPVPSEFATSPLVSPSLSPTSESMVTTEEPEELILPESATDNSTINDHTLNSNEEQNPGFKKYLMEKYAKDDSEKPNAANHFDHLILDKKGYIEETPDRIPSPPPNSNINNNQMLYNTSKTLRRVKSDGELDENHHFNHVHDPRHPISLQQHSEPNNAPNPEAKDDVEEEDPNDGVMSDSEVDRRAKPSSDSANKRQPSVIRKLSKWFNNTSNPDLLTDPSVERSESLDSSPESQPIRKQSQHYAKTLRLTSEQLQSLNLKEGINDITFTVNKATCGSRLFLWNCYDHIVISDIDGTITKSDALGHLFNMVGRDWTHLGVAKLYSDITKNGYKILYLTSRAIGQADNTRDYLRGVKQGPFQLPNGPVLMSPDRLFQSLHREVIARQPQVFKMSCLRDIHNLFGEKHATPFYAGFGNRITDAISYRTVDVPVSRIFTIDHTSEVKLELLLDYKSSYTKLNDLVDQIFPPIKLNEANPEFADFSYWKQDLPDIDLLLIDEEVKIEVRKSPELSPKKSPIQSSNTFPIPQKTHMSGLSPRQSGINLFENLTGYKAMGGIPDVDQLDEVRRQLASSPDGSLLRNMDNEQIRQMELKAAQLDLESSESLSSSDEFDGDNEDEYDDDDLGVVQIPA
ncbi:LNS2-domain-containing protein [Conidiobolus coronatus NRRL 28638]|uniref:LNS2-domain-containing protein n=1 Tax=Conidiobolus coronatus (strain ATCC 28846 / CBS 209.66 / NRRL 28638) TaxID=796925 RepID=A0A137P3S8_CONC2|nr:LNS2-domain-containing protein [Conidiobolus coronatus NRRL 28638]|eukprot:KXN69675.1 LNS2-domain-containing protein [Conidiobolus coronatus NRRL 28638]